ncbi:MAG TPA: MMPL family transporter [Candidatus Saccharimonadales bacterium]
MGKGLHKLGAFAFKHPWRIVAVWLVILAVLGVGAATYFKAPTAALTIPGIEAQKGINRASELFPDGGKGSGRIVFKAADGKEINDYKKEIEALSKDVEKVEGVSQVVSPFVSETFMSKDKTIAYAQVQLKEGNGSITETTFDGVRQKVEAARTSGIQVEMGGDLINNTPGEILGIGEVAGVILALVVLVVTLGSLVAAGMPIITALVSIAVTTAGLFSLSQLFTINTTTPVLAIMLGLAVGIDYSLFIISKYRSYALAGFSLKVAAARAIGTAGNAVVFAAMTVVIALAALSLVNIPFMTTMGLAGAASIAIAAAVAITLVPALLHFADMRIFGRKVRAKVVAAGKRGPKKAVVVSHKTIGYKWGEIITKRPWLAMVGAVLVVVAIALPVKHLELGLPTDQYAAHASTERKAYDLLTEGFGQGFNGPLTLVVEGLPGTSKADEQTVRSQAMAEYNKQVSKAKAAQEAYFAKKAAQAVTLEQQIALQQEIAAATQKGAVQQKAGLAKVDKTVEQYAKLVGLKKIADKIQKEDNVEQVLPAMATDDGKAGIIQVIPKSAPSNQATIDLIKHLRDPSTKADLTSDVNVSFAVTGSTALQTDINERLAAALPQYLAVVVGLSLVLLVVAFRSILVPIKATLGFLLSVLAMFGALVAVFQWGWFGIAEAPGPIVSFIPIIATGILFGLAMDYEFFLVSGMHEAYSHDKKKDAKAAVVRGFAAGSKVVTAAGIIMVSVFAGFITNHDATVQAIGFGLAVGILVDAFLVRMTIVPAVMTLLGRSAWWLPKWLDRRLPHVSIEGEE